jgi:hypothetical protein
MANQGRQFRIQWHRLLKASLWALACLPGWAWPVPVQTPLDMTAIYARAIDKRLEVPAPVALYYAALLDEALTQAGLVALPDQYLVLVDRSPQVQAVFMYWKGAGALAQLIGASPASTGRPGRFDYFETPVGVFAHSLDNLDFRAEGTTNENGIRGYGIKGMRVFDFGWQQAHRGWGDRKSSTMRLQMHATDPDLLEHRLGSAQSKGCIRIPATLNWLIDHYGLLDADYDNAATDGKALWMLPPDREPTPWPGRYLIVVDSMAAQRPSWAHP